MLGTSSMDRSHRPRGLKGIGCGLVPPRLGKVRPGFMTAPRNAQDDWRFQVLAPPTSARYLFSWASWEQARQYGALHVAAHLACAGTEASLHNRTLHLWPSMVCKYPGKSGHCALAHPSALGRVEQLFDLQQVSDVVTFQVANHTVLPEHTAHVNEHCAPVDAAALYPVGKRAVLLQRWSGGRRFPGCDFGHGMLGVQLAAALAIQLREKPRSPQALELMVAQACRRLVPAGCADEKTAHVRLLARILLSSRIDPLHSTRGWVETPVTVQMASSFRKHRHISLPVVPIADLAQKRAALDRLLRERLLGNRPETNEAQPDVEVSFGDFCPRSLGNIAHIGMNGMLLAVVLGAKVVFPIKQNRTRQLVCADDLHCTTCNGLLDFKAGAWVRDQNISRREYVQFNQCTEVQRLVTSAAAATAAGSWVPRGLAHTHQLAECLAGGRSRSDAVTTLFTLGAHVAYGAVFARTMLLVNEPAMPEDPDELRVSLHLRHCALMRIEPPTFCLPQLEPCAAVDENFSGAEGIEAVEAAVRNATVGTKRCALLAASDRMLTLHLLKGVADRVRCRLVLAPRHPSEELRSHGRVREHGLETSGVVLRDVFLLSRGDVVIGTWGSTLTLLVQELVAARSDGRVPPTVTYCDLPLSACMAPLPLHTTRQNAWHVTIGSSHGMKLRRSGRD